jgi:hypothetical protein
LNGRVTLQCSVFFRLNDKSRSNGLPLQKYYFKLKRKTF